VISQYHHTGMMSWPSFWDPGSSFHSNAMALNSYNHQWHTSLTDIALHSFTQNTSLLSRHMECNKHLVDISQMEDDCRSLEKNSDGTYVTGRTVQIFYKSRNHLQKLEAIIENKVCQVINWFVSLLTKWQLKTAKSYQKAHC
jgi:hypothetical protein